MTPSRSNPILVVAAAVGALGIAIRLNNIFQYPKNVGFDAIYNWLYIRRLLTDWSLPAPDELWASSHPPLFYYLNAALIRGLGLGTAESVTWIARGLTTLVGLASIGICVRLVQRSDPDNPMRALLAGALLLFLPAHIYMSCMLNEEILASSFATFGVAAAALAFSRGAESPSFASAISAGFWSGLAWLTKLSGILAVAATAGAYALQGIRRKAYAGSMLRVSVLLLVSLLIGGWYYANNRLKHGYFYPQNLEAHRVMFSMPPGERTLTDYVRVPLATWTDPQMLNPDLLRSVWGGTYATLWFDGHRYFLPRDSGAVRNLGTFILLLALLPTAAFGVGIVRGTKRLLRGEVGADAALLGITFLTLGGYVLFTWRNPWFASVKGSYLLGLSAPFSYYASEVLVDWTRSRRWVAWSVWTALGLLVLAVSIGFTYGPVFEKAELTGLEWR